MPPRRSDANETRNLRLPKTFLVRARSPVGTIQCRRGKRPAATGSTSSQKSCATDRHLQGAIRGHTAELGAIYLNGIKAASSRTRRLGLSQAVCKWQLGDESAGAGQRGAVRVIRPGWLPVRSGRSGPGPKDEDHRLDHHWQAQWSRRARRQPRRRHAVANRVHACVAR
jgi:hypothetical protein